MSAIVCTRERPLRVHYNRAGKSACGLGDRSHRLTTTRGDVTCRLCRRWLAYRSFVQLELPLPSEAP